MSRTRRVSRRTHKPVRDGQQHEGYITARGGYRCDAWHNVSPRIHNIRKRELSNPRSAS